MKSKSGIFSENWGKVMFGNISTSGLLNGKSLFLSLFPERDKTLPGLKKLKKRTIKFFLYSFNTLILTKIILFLVPDALILHYFGANPCWNNFGTSAFSGSIIQIPGLLFHPMACTLAKQGIIHAVIEVFIAAMVVVGIIALYIEDKYASQKPAINGNVSNSGQMGDIIGDHIRIKREQKDKNNFVPVEDDILPEVFRISGGSRFCWLDMYGENVYGPILWEEKSEESKNED
ncbi:hypothetical protein [Methanosarcina mazei]|nr:hypothetical protein [Methanosarcina mazei]WIM45673.1 hypothetical protein PQQ20_11805 [Methanosarcina mazei]